MIRISMPTPGDEAAIRLLFRDYPYRSHQQRRQGIDAERLAGMLWEPLRAAIDRPEQDLVMATDGGRPTGLAGLAPDAWHSGFFGLPMAKIQPFLTYPAPESAGPALLDALLNHARRRGYAHLSCRVDASDWASIRLLEAAGFSLVDGSQKLSRRLGGVRLEGGAAPEGVSCAPFTAGEEDALADLAGRSHDTNHFFNDPTLDRGAARRLFEEWVRRCCRGLARHVFVARQGERPVGFATYLGSSALQRHFGIELIILDFIVVDRAAQGRGLGRWLLAETLNALSDRYALAELRTSFNNYAALALYHRQGFETVAADVILHKLLSTR